MAVYREHIESPDGTSFRLLHLDGPLSTVRLCLGEQESVPIQGSGERWHAHRAVELTYIQSGRGARFIGDHIGAISPPELVLLGPDLPHYWNGLEETRGASVQLGMDRRDPLGGLQELSRLEPLWAAARHGLLFPTDVADEIGERLMGMAKATPLERLAGLLESLRQLELWLPRAQQLSDKPFALSLNAPHADKVSQVIDLLLDHYQEDLRIEDVAQAVQLSRATLFRYFRRYTGRSVVEFLNGVRIDRAQRLLVETTLPIGQIALEVGFRNLSHFNRKFLRAAGQSPRTYRRGGCGNANVRLTGLSAR